jgi:DNA-binding LacI/PurR family transcriptional regulator
MKGNNKINIYDVASLADVSISTVSRVLNNYPHVSEEKRKRVLEVLQNFNYFPSATARSLSMRKSRKIGVLVTDIRHSHYANIAYTIEQVASLSGYVAILCNTGFEEEMYTRYIRVLAEEQIDGLIIVGSVFSKDFVRSSLEEILSDIPVVMHNGNLESEQIYRIMTDDIAGMEITLDHLYNERGRRKIVFVQDYDTWVGRAKSNSYRSYLEERGYGKDCVIIHTETGLEGGERAAIELLESGHQFDAICGPDDLTAIGMMRRFKMAKLMIPDDVSMVSFNNSVHALTCSPTLSSVDNRMQSTGKALVDTLIERIEGRDVAREYHISPELVVRESS